MKGTGEIGATSCSGYRWRIPVIRTIFLIIIIITITLVVLNPTPSVWILNIANPSERDQSRIVDTGGQNGQGVKESWTLERAQGGLGRPTAALV